MDYVLIGLWLWVVNWIVLLRLLILGLRLIKEWSVLQYAQGNTLHIPDKMVTITGVKTLYCLLVKKKKDTSVVNQAHGDNVAR